MTSPTTAPILPVPTPEGRLNADLRGVHYDFLKARVSPWFIQGSRQRQEELSDEQLLQLPSWYVSATGQQKAALADSHTRFRESLNQVEFVLGGIQDVLAFAQAPLTDAIKQRFNLDVDVKNVYFARKYAPASRNDFWGAFVFDQQNDPSTRYEYRAMNLLEAALANFAPEDEKPLPCNDCHIITRWGHYEGEVVPTFEVLKAHAVPIAPHDFAKLCRDLDLGGLYQAHIKAIVQPQADTERKALERQLDEHQRQLLAMSTEFARHGFAKAPDASKVAQGISDDAYQMLKQLIAGQSDVTLDGRPVTVTGLKVFNVELVGPLLFGPWRESSERVERLVAYLPNDPQQPLREYASSADFMVDLRTRLHSVSYRRFFSRFVPQRQQGVFFKHFNALYQPDAGNGVQGDYPLQANPARLPLDEASIVGNLWQHQRQQQIQKIIGDAKAVAVPTKTEDRNARLARLQSFEDAVLNVFNLAAFVLPGLGPIMLAVGMAQMCDEVFEGIEAYEEGDIRQMWAHYASVALNAGFIASGGVVLPKVRWVSSIDHLRPVTLPTGQQKLWNPDLSAYETPARPAPDAKPDELGLYRHEGQTIVPIEGKHYSLKKDANTGQYRIQHPTRPEAYAPRVEHNQAGAWSHEAEEPLTWDAATLRRRMGLEHASLSTEQLEQAQAASGVAPDVLRQAFVEQEPAPLLLLDTLERFKLHQELTTFVEQMKSTDPAVYAKADPAFQLHMMQRRGMLPDTPPLRVIDSNGRVLWDAPSVLTQPRRVIALHENALSAGELIKDVLLTLEGLDPTLEQIPGEPADSLYVRAAKVRLAIGHAVDSFKLGMLEERYQARTRTDNADVQRLQDAHPKLPTSVAEQLIASLGAEDLQLLRTTRRLPEWLAEHANWYAQQTRMSRAYEGLYLDTLTSIDSQRLALRTLETLPGWRRGTRVELRHYSAQGTLLDAIGAVDSPVSKTLILQENGQFSARIPGDFYTAAWDALSAVERQQLGFSEAGQLKQGIQKSPLSRDRFSTVLEDHPQTRPAYDPAMRLLGGGPGVRQLLSGAANVFLSAQARVRKLFPTFTDEQVSAFIESLGEHVRAGLGHWENEYATLKNQLKAWVQANPPAATEAAGTHAEAIAKKIKSCWRRETGSELKLLMQQKELPALSADFSHVDTLSIYKGAWSPASDVFLKNFAHLKRLTLEARLEALPDVIGDMNRLTTLNLRSNRIRLNAQSAARLSGLRSLETLDLAGNPLTMTPDFSGMARLKNLDLHNTQIEQWPMGLLNQAGLENVDLRFNQLREVPQAHLNPPADQLRAVARINGVTLLQGNPFPADYWQQLDSFWQRVAEAFPDVAQAANPDAFSSYNPWVAKIRRMYPDKSTRQAREFFWALGEDAQAQLLSREQAFDVLQRQLNAWSDTGGGERQRYIRARDTHPANRTDRLKAVDRILSCWRQETPQVRAHDGTPIGLELDLSGLQLHSLPDLDVDFSHVGSLKLNNMSLSTSPEGFLARFKHLRRLYMTDNQLRELPPAVGEMNGLTILDLRNNLMSLTPETAAIVSGRVTLRGLILSGNRLGITPDFSQMPDMRSLFLQNAGISTWPTGLGEQPLLDNIMLQGNHITTIPDAVIAPPDALLAQSARVNNVTTVSENLLTEATLQQVRAYGERLVQAGLAETATSNRLVRTALDIRAQSAPSTEAVGRFSRWSRGFSAEQTVARKAQWLSLAEQEGADGFFRVFTDLEAAGEDHAELQRRVWDVLDAISENTAESENLRKEMFEWAGQPACCDRAALSFSNLEIMTLVFRARALALDQTHVVDFLKLSRGLFRLDQVEKIALQDIARRTQAIMSDARLTPAQKQTQIALLEEVEIRLAYRYGLKERLQLPAQPQRVRFTDLGRVTQTMLDEAYAQVVALDDSPQEFQALLGREYWQEYVTNKYRTQFEAQREPYLNQSLALDQKVAAGEITAAEYASAGNDLQAQMAIVEAELIETLTRTELAEHPLDQAASGPSGEEATDL